MCQTCIDELSAELSTITAQREQVQRAFKAVLSARPHIAEEDLHNRLQALRDIEEMTAKKNTLKAEKTAFSNDFNTATPSTWRSAIGTSPMTPKVIEKIRSEVFAEVFGAARPKPNSSAQPASAASPTALGPLNNVSDRSRREAATARYDDTMGTGGDANDWNTNDECAGPVGSAAVAQEKCASILSCYFSGIRAHRSKDTRQGRERVFQAVCALGVAKCLSKMRGVFAELTENQASLRDAEDERNADFLGRFKIIGATTTGCAGMLSAIRKIKPKIVIVEEAAEVLESHVIACLTEGVEHLILIGDHKQLQPKPEQDIALGIRKNLSVSLMERLVRLGAPYVTLTTQRRMHPDVSEFHKDYYWHADTDRNEKSAAVIDHPRTLLIPKPIGVAGDMRVALIGHDGVGAKAERFDEGMASYYNDYESRLALAIYLHLSRANPGASITILVPYVAHTNMTASHAQSLNITYRSQAGSGGVRIASIDNYQGEEDDFILICLTRTASDGFEKGFLRQPNRVCVTLSRAKRAMYVIACLPALLRADNPLWKTFISILKERNGGAIEQSKSTKKGVVNKCILDSFPAHNAPLNFSSYETFERIKCSAMCGAKLNDCNHLCQKTCHAAGSGSPHGHCAKACERVGAECTPKRHCVHPCQRPCSQPCGPCSIPVSRTCTRCGSRLEYFCGGISNESVSSCDDFQEGIAECGHTVTATCKEWTLVDMPCCGNTMLSGELDIDLQAQLESSEECTSTLNAAGDTISMINGPFTCPLCDAPMMPHYYRRWGAEIKRRWLDIDAVLKQQRKERSEALTAVAQSTDASLILRDALAAMLHVDPHAAARAIGELKRSYSVNLPEAPPTFSKSRSKADRRKRNTQEASVREAYNKRCAAIKEHRECSVTVLTDAIAKAHLPPNAAVMLANAVHLHRLWSEGG